VSYWSGFCQKQDILPILGSEKAFSSLKMKRPRTGEKLIYSPVPKVNTFKHRKGDGLKNNFNKTEEQNISKYVVGSYWRPKASPTCLFKILFCVNVPLCSDIVNLLVLSWHFVFYMYRPWTTSWGAPRTCRTTKPARSPSRRWRFDNTVWWVIKLMVQNPFTNNFIVFSRCLQMQKQKWSRNGRRKQEMLRHRP
jgi:hypothetical protein